MLEQLAQLLKTRKGKYILFLGAGASVTSGGKTTNEIVTGIVEEYTLDSSDPWNSFCTFLKKKSEGERFDILSKYFKDMEPSAGYKILAKLVEEGYFRLILTTNFDYMLEGALKGTNLFLNRDYFVCIIGEGKERILIKEIEDGSMIRIVKLHGDYKRKILPFTEEETFQFEKELEKCLKKLTEEGIVFVGYSGMDKDVLKCLSPTGGSVWWVNPRKVTADATTARNSSEYLLNEDVYRILINRNSHDSFIWGEYGKSDTFFEKIYEKIFLRDINSFCDQFKFRETRYRKMKDLFEPPYQYEEMKRKLTKHKVLLILGEAHLGKTYTALNLLYDYYTEGFNVDFRSELNRREVQQEMLYQSENLLKPNTVVYLEDPFGGTEPVNVQIFRYKLKRIIRKIQNSESMVIITSRLNIFKEVGDPSEFPMIVELMKQDKSYDQAKRKRIVDNYVAVYKPIWKGLLNETIDGRVLREYIAKELKEPHNIELFVEKSSNTRDIDSLLQRVKESKEIFEVFKAEIERSDLREKIFLYLCFIFQKWWSGLIDLKRSYPKVAKIFELNVCERDLDMLLRKFNFRVEIFQGVLMPSIRFSHPDFSRAIEETFGENADLIGRILVEMAKDSKNSVKWSVIETISSNFENLTDEYRKLLFDLAKDENGSVRRGVVETIGSNFENLTDEYRKLLFELARDEDISVRERVAWTVTYNFENLTDEYRKLLFELAKDEIFFVRRRIVETISSNFENLTDEYRRLLFELARDEDVSVRRGVLDTIGSNFENLTDEYRKLLFELSEDEDISVRRGVAWTISSNFENLTDEYRKLLFELARDEDISVRERVAWTVTYNFENLTDEYRRLLFELAKDKSSSVRRRIAWTVTYYFKNLTDKYRKLLFELAKDKSSSVREEFAWTISSDFKNLTDEYRRLLFVFAKDENWFVRRRVAETVLCNFENLTDEYRRLLFDLAEDENWFVRRGVLETIRSNFENLTDEYRRLLFVFAKDEDVSVRRGVLETIRSNFKNLTDEYRKLLFVFAKDENSFVRRGVVMTIDGVSENLAEDYRKLLLILSEDEAIEVKTAIALTIGRRFEDHLPEYRGILEKFKSDSPVLDSLRDWIRENEANSWEEKAIKTLRRELDI